MEILLVKGFLIDEPSSIVPFSQLLNTVVIILYLIWVIGTAIQNRKQFRQNIPDIILSLILFSTLVPIRAGGGIVSFRIILWTIFTFLNRIEISDFFTQIRINPARLLLLSFLGMIFAGTVLLMFPASTVDHKGASFIDALFTASSATCVTGLIVQDTGSYFTFFGQLVILMLIQVGGLGIMTFSTLFAIILGQRLGLKHEENLREMMDQKSSQETYKLIIQIIRITLLFEGIGALILFLRWLPSMAPKTAFYAAVFHSISAFCNAGFSLFSQNLSIYVGDITVNLVIILLIIFGGLGFVVINDLIINLSSHNPFKIKISRLSVHSKLVLITTAILIIFGTFFVFFFEFDNTMLAFPLPTKFLAAVFQSVTFRTAGFNTIDFGKCTDITLFIGILLMFIGASPASTGGGIKTTTFAVLVLSVRSLLQSKDKVEIYQRTIPPQTVYKSIAIALFSFTFISSFCVLLLATQKGSFIQILFEATSAIGTVGVSTGITSKLTGFGKLLISILVYVGRVGPLTVALALGEVRKVNIQYPTTRISVG
jgi:trk system potassium uptake protein TrkH